MMLSIVLLIVALAMTAFFAGTETGFYRLSRLRLVTDAMAGDRRARILLWFANQPSVFVATALVGATIASDLTSFAVVMLTDWLFPDGGIVASILPPLLVTPVMFIGGDLFPKNVFYNAPNRLMHRCVPGIAVAAALFAPLTVILWLLSLVLQLVARERPQEILLRLARRELNMMLVEGSEAGILRPIQRTLAQNMLAMAGQPVRNFASPPGRVVRVTTTMPRSDVLRIAQRHNRTLLPLEDTHDKRKLLGFIRTIDLVLAGDDEQLQPQPFVQLSENETFLSALGKLGVAQDALGHVVNAAGRTIGFVTGRELRLALLSVQ
jgi:CBS domain containing-hemolysin-like protein